MIHIKDIKELQRGKIHSLVTLGLEQELTVFI